MRKVNLLVLHIICAILFGVSAVMVTNAVAATLHTLSSILWGVIVGMDISGLIHNSK